jgi:cytochrome c
MDDRFNTIAGWTLFSGVVALGLSSVSARYFGADKNHRPEKMGYEIEGVVSSEEGAAAAVPLPTLLAAADPAKGEQAFKKCASCHTIAQGAASGIGPNLWGTVGKTVASVPGFAYSDPLKALGGAWSFDKLDPWLANPKKMVPGTKMTFAGLSSAEDRANLIVYLNAQGSNLPLPAAPAAAAPEAAAAVAPAGGAPVPAAGGAPAPGGSQAALPIGQASPDVLDNRAVGAVHETQAQ